MRAILIPPRPGPRVSVGLLVFVLVLLSAGCASRSAAGGGKLRVVASFYPLAHAVSRLGGGCVEVTDLTPSGVEPHDLELTPDDLVSISEADLVVHIGSGFQPAVEDAVGETGGVVADVLDAVSTRPATDPGSEGPSVDPHVWLDPKRYATVAETIADAMTRAGLPSRCEVDDRLARLTEELGTLDAAFRDGLAGCASNLIVTSHAAFAYLAEAYGLRQEAIAGVEPESQPSARRLAELERLVRGEGVTTILTEELVSPEVAETLADEAGVSTAVLRTIEARTVDEVSAGLDYGDLMRENLATLRAALDCP